MLEDGGDAAISAGSRSDSGSRAQEVQPGAHVLLLQHDREHS